MATNLHIDTDLLTKAQHIGHFHSKRETVNSALKEFVQRRKQLEILDWEGKVDFHEGYDYKALRKRKSPHGTR